MEVSTSSRGVEAHCTTKMVLSARYNRVDNRTHRRSVQHHVIERLPQVGNKPFHALRPERGPQLR
jgi:hypothetical protein